MKVIIGRKLVEMYDGSKVWKIKAIYSSLSEHSKPGVKDGCARVMLSNAIRKGTQYNDLYWSREEIDNDMIIDFLNEHPHGCS